MECHAPFADRTSHAVIPDLLKKTSMWRRQLEEVWARDTAYPGTNLSAFDVSVSAGQCAVSSILLINRLPSLKRLNPRFILGQVRYKSNNKVAIDYHGWIEFDFDNEEYVLDITADQAKNVHTEVVLCKKEEMAAKYDLMYLSEKLQTSSDSRTKEVWDRYIRLSRKLAEVEVGSVAVEGLQSKLDLTGVSDNDITKYLFDKLSGERDPKRARLLSAALELSRKYSFSDTRTYPRPDHPDPMKRRSASFTLVAVVASLRTTLENEQKAVLQILNRYQSDDALFNADKLELTELLRPVGLAESKANVIIEALTYLDKFHNRNWDTLASMPLPDARGELLSLKGLGPKSVDCILTVGLGRPSIAVDVNVFRVTSRIMNLPWAKNPNYGNRDQVSLIKEILDDLVGTDAFLAQILHTLFLLHGKHVCKAKCAHDRSQIQDLCLKCELDYISSPWQKGLF